jgi:hypothetical protein
MSTPIFKSVDNTETRLDYKGHKFLLVEQNRGVYGMGRAIQLYQLDGLKKEHIKEIGWTRGDNNGGAAKPGAYLPGIVTSRDCKEAAVKYIDSIL